jgi:hypothetical protein
VSASHTASLLASGSSAIDALDGGYRLAFTVALISVLVAIVLAVLILHPKSSPPESPETVDESFDAESETMIAEIM